MYDCLHYPTIVKTHIVNEGLTPYQLELYKKVVDLFRNDIESDEDRCLVFYLVRAPVIDL